MELEKLSKDAFTEWIDAKIAEVQATMVWDDGEQEVAGTTQISVYEYVKRKYLHFAYGMVDPY
jgi:hypothetical protein